MSTSLLRQGAYTIGFDVNIALMWGRTIAVGVRETMGNPAVNNYTAADGLHLWIVGLEGDRHWPRAGPSGRSARVARRPAVRDGTRSGRERPRADRRSSTRCSPRRPRRVGRARSRPSPSCSGRRSTRSTTCSATSSSSPPGPSSTCPDEDGGRAMLASPADFEGRAPTPRWRAPQLGEHTTEVLLELGRSRSAIDRLLEAGVAGPPGDRR